ncbi:zinc protease [Rhodoblastus acidophilus]|uniref:Zinc protease n=1 Tax=Rhodoblastus acidophilus TaxID=1074 RepID=A0A212RKU2_RHOAC|nr:pitrilysin family protein [Rhodoblastus acidophilus]PPQ35998.1 insulinase family protein [Rhodoblastus acidophilus]RAI18307.1 insulinase family protein [Rhodoblastus acidophilus]SNB72925.1 zinc protease [Rhodoblastus acidophilus]
MNAPAKISRASRVQQIVTPFGIKAWLVEDYAVPLVALEFSFEGGAAQDPQGKAGAASMLAGMLDEGAGHLDSEQFQRALDDHAIRLHFSADRDELTGHLQTLTRNLDKAFELVTLALNAPRFDAEPLERVRGQINAMLKRESKDPDAMAGQAWRRAAWPNHPYARSPRGELGEVDTVGREDLVALHRKLLARDALKIAVVGAIDAATLATKLDALFSGLPAQAERAPLPQTNIAGLGRRVLVDLDVPQANIRYGRPGLTRHDPDFIAATVVNHIWGGGSFTSRLWQEVREKRGLTYSVYSMLSTPKASPGLIGATSTKNERAAESLSVISEEARRMAEEGPTADELEKAKKYLVGSYALRFDTSTKIAGHLLQLQQEGFAPDYLDRRNAEIEAVTIEDARRVARRLLGDGQFLVAVVGRPEGLNAG